VFVVRPGKKLPLSFDSTSKIKISYTGQQVLVKI